ncbi:hypothetical protein JR316_0004442 [Psilocybe cubensis]|uniref:DUF6535 domain-containing protein n=2 Tax=Psilocybe cubensis TaxID=181762 RepID=A0A8H7Y0E8_PSICU|nr:hypothetical protein JR316_0004442 [Psilocybe cubensis]KAH9482344.1 hypothetical protein JR316_0004442 [Psilocybe cubensis]
MSATTNGSHPINEKGSMPNAGQKASNHEEEIRKSRRPNAQPPKASTNVSDQYTAWNLGTDGEKFKFAPPAPEGDPWSLLLEPLLERDRIQCDTWKNEVNNVLFFATLFSAVVTAFVIESYKSLTDDPQVVLLAHIANRLDSSLNGSTSPIPPSALPGDPAPADVRINSFWFMSLVLSLTTVLFGIISLQWLSEHQGYSELTPKQAFAVFQMRADGIKKWYLPKVFTALPVLLQGAVVLFLVGMVDFSLPLGLGVSIPTIIAIGLTLLFYIATTVLPTLQGLSFYLPFVLSDQPLTAPPQCPYKSPQSRAFRIVFHFVFHIAHFCYQCIIEPAVRFAAYQVPYWLGRIPSIPQRKHDPIISLLSPTWHRRTWQEFDLSWIYLRDHYAFQRFDREGFIDDFQLEGRKLMPVYDTVLGLRDLFRATNKEVKEDYLATIYHCFCDVSRSVTDHVVNAVGRPLLDSVAHHHQYFYSLIDDRYTSLPRLSDYLHVHPNRTIDTPNFIDPEWMMLHHEHIVLFFCNVITDPRDFRAFRMHLVEIQTRAMKWIYDRRTQIIPSTLLTLTQTPLVTPISITGAVCNHTRDDDIERAHELWWQYANIYLMFFEYAGSDRPTDLQRDIHAGCHIPDLILQIEIDLSYLRDFNYDKTINKMADDTLKAMLTIIQDRLENYMHQQALDERKSNRNLLFYTAAIFLRRFNCSRNQYPRSYLNLPIDVDEVLETLALYKHLVLDVNGRDALLEARFAGIEKYDAVTRFTPTWWKFLDDVLPKRFDSHYTTKVFDDTAGTVVSL